MIDHRSKSATLKRESPIVPEIPRQKVRDLAKRDSIHPGMIAGVELNHVRQPAIRIVEEELPEDPFVELVDDRAWNPGDFHLRPPDVLVNTVAGRSMQKY